MKVSKLFKRLGALLTAVAVLASMGTVAFAVGGYTIAIGDASITPTEDVVDGEGVYTITVPYTIKGTFGDKGLTALAYTNGTTNDELEVGDSFSEYKSEYKIAYVTQEVDPEVDEDGAGSISFNIDTTGEDAIEVGAGEKILVLIGGDGVENPGAVLLTTYWTASAEAALVSTANGSEFTGLGSAITVNLDTTTFEDAVWEALDGYEVRVKDEKGNTAPVEGEAVTIEVVEATGDGITHKAIITVDKSKAPEGVYMNENAVYEFNFAADVSWTADTLVIDPSTYAIYKDAIGVKTVAEALKDAILAKTVKVTKTTPALEAVVDAAANASNITVELNEEDAGFTGAENDTEVKFDVTLAAGTYGDAIVGTGGLKTTVKVNYQLETPSAWTVSAAEYIGTEIEDIEEAQAADYDFTEYAATALNGEMVTLKDASGNTYELTLATTGDAANCAVVAVVGEPNADDVATVTVTVTINATTIESGVTEITVPADPAITFTTTFTSKMETGLIGDVNGDDVVNVMDASAVQMYAFFNTPLVREDLADVNGDRNINVMDASAIQMYAFFNTPFLAGN